MNREENNNANGENTTNEKEEDPTVDRSPTNEATTQVDHAKLTDMAALQSRKTVDVDGDEAEEDAEAELQADGDSGTTEPSESTDYPIDKPQGRLAKPTRVFKRIFDRIIPPFEPRLPIEERLVPGEVALDNTRILYFAAIQILLGLVSIAIGFFTFAFFAWVGIGLLVLGVVLVVTGFEIEEIYVTNSRLLIRRIGLVERIFRIPSDEEHGIQHAVSFVVGRAPMNKALVVCAIGLLSPLPFEVVRGSYVAWVIGFTSAVLLYFGLRLGRRSLTVFLAGGHQVVLGVRKGLPNHILDSFMRAVHAYSIPVATSDEERK